MSAKSVLAPRREGVLRLIIGEHVATAAPVSSESIARRLELAVSPATVRNEMAALEEEGYITRPHTSAGGVPSDKGYRYYVEFLAEVPELPLESKLVLRMQLERAERDVEVWTRLAGQFLSQLARNMAIATYPRLSESRLRHLELVQLQETLALLIIVLQEAKIRKEVLPLREVMGQEELTQVVNRLNSLFSGLTRQEMVAKHVELSPLEEQVVQAAIRIIWDEDRDLSADYFVEGLRHLLSQPEFATPERVRTLVEMLEDRRMVSAILAAAPGIGAFRVVIGQENSDEALRPFSVILAQYGVPGDATGVMGVLGPTRMEYAWSIAGVRYLASLMSELMEGVWGKPSLS